MSPWLSDLFLSSQSDQRLAALAQTGHQQAFTTIVRRYQRELGRFASRVCAEGKADDVLQQTFLSAFNALQNGCEVKHLRAWLYAILRHHAARAGAHAGLESEPTDLDLAGIPLEDVVDQRLAALQALSEIKRLPDNQRAALAATALEGRSRAEIATLMGLSEGSVRQLVHRARATVRAAVTAITPLPVVRWFAVRSRSVPAPPAELLAGAGGASTGAVVLKVGTLVVAGLGVAGLAGLGPQPTHHRAATVSIAQRSQAPAGSAPALAGFVRPLDAGSQFAGLGQPGTGGGPARPGTADRQRSRAESRGEGEAGGRDGHGGSDGSLRGGDGGQSDSSGGSLGSGSGDTGGGGSSGGSGSGDSSATSNGGSDGGGGGGSTTTTATTATTTSGGSGRGGGTDGLMGDGGGTSGGGGDTTITTTTTTSGH